MCNASPSVNDRRIFGYVPGGDKAALSSLSDNCARIATVLAETYKLVDWSGGLHLVSDKTVTDFSANTIPVLTFSARLDAVFSAEKLADPIFLSGLAGRIQLLSDGRASGLCLDLSGFPSTAGTVVATAVNGLISDGPRCVIGSADADFWSDKDLVAMLDIAVVLGFRTPEGPATPSAPTAWFEPAYNRIVSLIPKDKLVIALGTQGYLWHSGSSGLEDVGYTEAMTGFAAEDAPVMFVPWANATRSRFVNTDNVLTEAWVPDAVSVYRQLSNMAPDVSVAVWPIGSEDPMIWGLFDAQQSPVDVLQAPILLETSVQVVGHGPTILSATLPKAGVRLVTIGDNGDDVVAADYQVVPGAARVQRSAVSPEGQISLTFSSFPPRDQWDALSKILATEDIQATFLVDSRDLLVEDAIARLAVADGHIVGIRQNTAEGSASALAQINNNFHQLLVEERTGLRTRLVEAGRVGNWGQIVANSERLLQAGYIPLVPVGNTPLDATAAPSLPDQSAVNQPRLQLDRLSLAAEPYEWPAVVRDLPDMLARLTAQGYRFQPLIETIGLSETDAMPRQSAGTDLASSIAIGILSFSKNELNTIFYWFLIYSVVRSIVYLGLAIVRRPKTAFDPYWTPPVSILIPAFNEAKVIENCIKSILDAPYPNLRVVVVDDGSTDGTYDVVNATWGNDERVTLIRQANGGKWAAANKALEVTDTPFFIVADADSIFTADTIAWLVQAFRDDRVGAVAGQVEVGNRDTLLGQCQALEYIVSQSIIRRAQEVFNGILVVPGAVGAWRTQAVRDARLFSGQTVTEDADLTVAVHRAGYRVAFQEQAVSVTEAPANVRGFMRQRLRWTFGMLQTSWKHRGAITSGLTVGYISIIDAIWFGVVTALFAPLVDILLLVIVVQGLWAVSTGGVAVLASVPVWLVMAYLALTVIDIVNTLVAFYFERRMDWKLLLLVPFLRFGYRQMLYISTIRAMGQAIAGTAASWNKLERSGAVLSIWRRAKLEPAIKKLAIIPSE